MSTRIEHRLRAAGARVLSLAATMVVASALSQAQTHVTSVFTGPYDDGLTAGGGSCVPVTPPVIQKNANGLSLSANLTCGNAKVGVSASMVILITEQKMPIFDYAEDTPFDKVVGTWKLQASLHDSATSQQLAVSAPILYSIVPGVAATAGLVLRAPTVADAFVDATHPVEIIQDRDRTHEGTEGVRT